MKHGILTVLVLLFFAFGSCSNVSPDAVELRVDFTWEGMVPCSLGGNPVIHLSGVPDETKILMVILYDHSGIYHTKQTLIYDGSSIIKKGSLDEITSPCPFFESERYKF